MTKPKTNEGKKNEEIKEQESQESTHEEALKLCEEEVRSMKNAYLRALADYKNLENRVQNERNEMKDTIKKQIVEAFMPVLDNMDQAELFTKDPGLKMVSQSFYQALEQIGVKPLELLGQEYDPYTAEVIEVVDGEDDNHVVEVLQKGYSLNGTVIRHAKVKVSKQTENNG